MIGLLLPSLADSSTRPRYGGTVRVLMQHKIASLDPLAEVDYAADRDKLDGLVYETLTEVDPQGHIRPRLADSWQADPSRRIWQMQLRPANFHDGSAVTAALVAASLRSSAPDWKITPSGKTALSIEMPAAAPRLPEILSLPRFAIVKRLADNTLSGSGPYRLSEWQAGERAVFSVNEDYWGGRAYADTIEVQMGASLREHLLERNLGRDNAVELGLEQLRSLEQTSQNLILSRPSELLVLVFLQPDRTAASSPTGKKPVDPRIREAIGDAMNRSAISNVLLQRKGVPAAALLPQWLSGWEFLFPDAPDINHARKLRTETGAVPPVSLAYDFSDVGARMAAERIAVDAREAGITVQPFGDSHVTTKSGRKASTADAVVLRIPLRSLDPTAALASVADELDLPAEITAEILSAGRAEDLYDAERRALDGHRIVPIAHVSQALWLNSTVHNWQQLANGGWKLDQLWTEGTR